MLKKKELVIRMKGCLADRKISHTNLLSKLENKRATSKSSLERYLSSSESVYPPADFIEAFCESLNVSSDYILGLNSNSVIESSELTPYTVFKNLYILLKQIDFEIDFQDSASCVTLTTSNPGVIDFLYSIRKRNTQSITDHFISEISNDYKMLGNMVVSENEMKYAYIDMQLDLADEFPQEYAEDLDLFAEKYGFKEATLVDMFLHQWESMTSEQKAEFATSYEESHK